MKPSPEAEELDGLPLLKSKRKPGAEPEGAKVLTIAVLSAESEENDEELDQVRPNVSNESLTLYRVENIDDAMRKDRSDEIIFARVECSCYCYSFYAIVVHNVLSIMILETLW